ncbi:MAG: XdhC family protein [Lachnospiraceae bacterium]|nr:XdhC family protein [Lachnospiraceae bacterium]
MITRLESIVRTLEAQKSLILVNVLASSGSTPRGAGAMMLVFEDGHTEGTIGGGMVEYRAILHAKELFKTQSSDTIGYCLNKNDVADLGMICGGDVTVYFQYLQGKEMLPLFRHLLNAYSKNENCWLIRRIEDHAVTAMAIHDGDGLHYGKDIETEKLPELLKSQAVYRKGTPSYYAEPVTQTGFVYIFGGGHVSQELVPVLAHLGFPVVVFEDREAFADPRLFPGARNVILGDFQKIEASVTFTPHDYVIIMTRGHQADFEILAQVLKHPLSYIGCIGSRSKIAATRKRLVELGYPENIYDQVHAPIGLAIQAETPAEIAISIAGELIRHRAESN